MLRKILLCTDLTPASHAMLECIGELVTSGLEEVVLLHALYAATAPGLETSLLDLAMEPLNQERCQLEAMGLQVRVEVPFGMPVYEIEAMAQKHKVDAIVLGSRSGTLFRSSLGSVAFRVLQITRHPVLLLRINLLQENDITTVAPCTRLFTSLLVPYDFSSTSNKALSRAREFALTYQCPLHLLHVNDNEKRTISLSPKALQQQDQYDQERLTQLSAEMHSEGIQSSWEMAVGIPAQEILRRGNYPTSSLIIMGNQGKGVFREMLLGSVANEVARQATLPILFVPAQA